MSDDGARDEHWDARGRARSPRWSARRHRRVRHDRRPEPVLDLHLRRPHRARAGARRRSSRPCPASPRCRTSPRARARCWPRATSGSRSSPTPRATTRCASALAQLRHRRRLQGRPPPARRCCARCATRAASTRVYGEELGRAGRDARARRRRRRGPYFSTVIVPARRDGHAGSSCDREPRPRRTQVGRATRRDAAAPRARRVQGAGDDAGSWSRSRSCPRGELVWPYAVDAALLVAVVVASRAPTRDARRAARRSRSPFVLFVVVLPFVGAQDGLWLAFGIVAKATLAVLATGVLAWTTPAPEILRGAERLRAAAPARRDRAASRCATCRSSLDELRRMRLARVAARRRRALAVAVARGGARRRRAGRAHVRARRARARRRCSRAATTAACRRCGSSAGARRWRGRGAGSCRRSRWRSRSPSRGWRDRPAHVGRTSTEVASRRRCSSSATARRDADGARGVLDARRARPRGRGRAAGRLRLHRAGRAAGRRAASTSSSRAAPTDVVSVPLVLLAAGHLKNDGPAALTRARSRHPGVAFRMGRDLGIDPVVLDVVEERARAALGDDDPAEVAVVLVGRGSSDPDATLATSTRSRACSPTGAGSGMVEPAFAGVARPDVAGGAGALPAARRDARSSSSRSSSSPACSCRASTRQAAGRGRPSTPRSTCVAAAHLGPDRRLARLVLERYREALTGDVRMNCDLCTYRVRLPGYEDKVGTPISLTPHGDGPARGRRRSRRATRAPLAPIELAPRAGCGPRRRSSARGTPPALDVRGLRFAYPDGSAGAGGRRPATSRPGERVAVLGPERRGQDDARARSLRRARGAARGRSPSAASSSRARRAPRSAAAPGSSSRTPTTSSSCRPSRRTSPSARPTRGCAATRCARGSTRRSTPCALQELADARRRTR